MSCEVRELRERAKRPKRDLSEIPERYLSQKMKIDCLYSIVFFMCVLFLPTQTESISLEKDGFMGH